MIKPYDFLQKMQIIILQKVCKFIIHKEWLLNNYNNMKKLTLFMIKRNNCIKKIQIFI